MEKSYKAFTLAEVLVTLAVIGVVASLTIPTVVKHYQKQQWITKYKQTYSILNQATKMVLSDNGGVITGAFADEQDSVMYSLYKKYLNIAKSCENINPYGNCFANNYISLRNLPTIVPTLYTIILKNGTSVSFDACGGTTAAGAYNRFAIDINGQSGPNIHGKDFHYIYLFNDFPFDPMKPNGWNMSNASIDSDCPSNLGVGGLGAYCGVRILRGDYAEAY